jgi:Flp pilus assembly protein TadD/mono/diheme cytochrome c family protein
MRTSPIAAALSTLSVLLSCAVRADASEIQNAAISTHSSTSVTWSRDIAPLAYNHCSTCHHPGGGGPFSLMSYADARSWGPQIAAVTRSHFMPPWLPEPGYGNFSDVRRLSDRDVDLIRRWVKSGMPQGDPSQAPAPPHFDGTWQLGKPDLVLKVAQPFTLPAGGSDVFRNFVLPYPLAQTHFIRAIEIVPGTPQIVHHANIILDRTASFRRQHPSEWQSGAPGMELLVDSGNRFDPDSHFLFWKPDTPAIVEPEGMSWRLDPGNDLILNMHLKPSGKTETVDAQVGLYFTDRPPTAQPMLLQLDRDDALDIPPGDAHFVVEDTLTLPIDVDVLGVYPHAHYLGRDLEGWAALPNGEKKWLVWIRTWDIDRQSVYRYKEPLRLPKGTVLHMRYTYDNSTANIHNPHNPPVRVQAGNRSEDEMSHLWLQVLPVRTPPNDPDPRLLLEEAWMRNRLRKSPRDHVSVYNLAASLAGEAKYAEAVRIFEQALQLNANDPRTLTALGAALDGAGDWQQAQARYRSAIEAATNDTSAACDARFDLATSELRHDQPAAETDFRLQVESCPADAETLANLAQIELASNETKSATDHLHEALRIDPSSADVHEQLAQVHAASGDLNGALAELRQAVELKPDDAAIHAAMSQVLTSMGNLALAIEEQRKALELGSNDADGWNNLGVLDVRSGHFTAAREAFQRALAIDPTHAEAKANLARLEPRKN